MWQQGLCLVMCREALMAEWGGASMTDADLCVWRTVSGKVGRSAAGRTPPVETDWCGGGWRSVGGCQLWWVFKRGTPIKAGRRVATSDSPEVQLPIKAKQMYMSQWLTEIGQRSQRVYVGREGSLSERSVAHSPSLQLSPQIWICHTCLHTWHLITGQQSKPKGLAPLV